MKRHWHHWLLWECVSGGMYETLSPAGHSADTALRAYTEFLRNLPRFEKALNRVLVEWPLSCQQFLSNPNINKIAWLGQSSMCIATGVPRQFRVGFARLTEQEQLAANRLAAIYLHWWETENGEAGYEETETPAPKSMHSRIVHYVETWERRCYHKGIPDEVPPELMRLNLAPSHKAIALAILKNDHTLATLGYTAPVSPWVWGNKAD